jgi:hypothetical protein
METLNSRPTRFPRLIKHKLNYLTLDGEAFKFR